MWDWVPGALGLLGGIAGVVGVVGFCGMILGFLAPYGWFAGEDVDRRSRARILLTDLLKQAVLTIVVIEVWMSIRGQ